MFFRFLFLILVFCNYAFSQADFNVSIKLNQYDSIYFSEASNISSNAITIYSDTTFSIKSSSKLFYVQTNNYKYYLFIDENSTIEINCNSNNQFLIHGANSNFIIFLNEYYNLYKPKIDSLFLKGYVADQFEIELYNLISDEIAFFYKSHKLFDVFSTHCHDYFQGLLKYEYLNSISSYLIKQKKDTSQIFPFYSEFNINLLDRLSFQQHLVDTNYYGLDIFQNYISNAFILFSIDDFKYMTQKNNNVYNFKTYLFEVVEKKIPHNLLLNFLNYYASNYAQFSDDRIVLYVKNIFKKYTFDELIVNRILDCYSNNQQNSNLLPESSSIFDFYMENEQGDIVSLDSFQGKLLYIDIWASWCGPCRKQFPYAQELKKKFSKRQLKKIKFIYISIDNDHEKWKESLNKLDLSGYQFISPANNNNGAGNYFQISSIPRYIIIDKNGNVLQQNAKRPSDETLFQDLLDLIN